MVLINNVVVYFSVFSLKKFLSFRLPEGKNSCLGHPPVAVSERCGSHCRHEQCKETISLCFNCTIFSSIIFKSYFKYSLHLVLNF